MQTYKESKTTSFCYLHSLGRGHGKYVRSIEQRVGRAYRQPHANRHDSSRGINRKIRQVETSAQDAPCRPCQNIGSLEVLRSLPREGCIPEPDHTESRHIHAIIATTSEICSVLPSK